MRRRLKRIVAATWMIYAHLAGGMFIALGTSAWIVWFFGHNEGPVVDEIGEARAITREVKVGGSISYKHNVWRRESCEGDVVTTLSRLDSDSQAVITFTRKANPLLLPTGIHEDVMQVLKLPEEVRPGRWLYILGINSRCPLRNQYDELVRFEFLVTPGDAG
jgi:hypothetical protein